ncbi:MAG: adenylate/guanylate cyclase domain-containing protein [Acidobacteria bacterium]|nr:adenylate/guanylate cyclase domain-containing protein [Acidobacteriota bacterium]
MAWTEHLPGALDWFVNLGARADDTQRERTEKMALVLIVAVSTPIVLVWSVVFGYLGLPIAAAIPVVYGVGSAVGLVVLARTKRIGLFRASQMLMVLTLPFLMQWSLGGFANGSAVAMWAMVAPLLAHVAGASLWPWFAGFAGLSVLSGLIDSSVAETAPEIPTGVITTFFVLSFLGVALVMFVPLLFFIGERERARIALDEQNRLLAAEQEKSERLLLNVLPAAIAERLKRGEEPIADRIPEVTVVVADIVGFTPMSEQVAPTDVVHLLNELFSKFDDLTDELGLEKLKTIGDAYQAMGGLPGTDPDHTAAIADLALAMGAEADQHTVPGFGRLQLRIGIDVGPVVAGVIGKRKFSYEIWGDTINTASRMESHGVPGHIQVTEHVYDRLRDRYLFEPRGVIAVKGKGDMPTYFLLRRLPDPPTAVPGSEQASTSTTAG